jgi:hypothetical protein
MSEIMYYEQLPEPDNDRNDRKTGLHHYDKDGTPLELFEWADKFEDFPYRKVANTDCGDGIHVSTVWLGLDHNFSGVGPPLIFETMVFAKRPEYAAINNYQERYSTLDEAKAGHDRIVSGVRSGSLLQAEEARERDGDTPRLEG